MIGKEGTVIRGIIRGKTIDLDSETGLQDGERVVIVVQSEADALTADALTADALTADALTDRDAALTLEAIHRMRHIGRSVVKP